MVELKRYRVLVTCRALLSWEGFIIAPDAAEAAAQATKFCVDEDPWQDECTTGQTPEVVRIEEVPDAG